MSRGSQQADGEQQVMFCCQPQNRGGCQLSFNFSIKFSRSISRHGSAAGIEAGPPQRGSYIAASNGLTQADLRIDKSISRQKSKAAARAGSAKQQALATDAVSTTSAQQKGSTGQQEKQSRVTNRAGLQLLSSADRDTPCERLATSVVSRSRLFRAQELARSRLCNCYHCYTPAAT